MVSKDSKYIQSKKHHPAVSLLSGKKTGDETSFVQKKINKTYLFTLVT
jgi:hypothetical protein